MSSSQSDSKKIGNEDEEVVEIVENEDDNEDYEEEEEEEEVHVPKEDLPPTRTPPKPNEVLSMN